MSLPPLYVISVVSNPVRYASRYRLFKEFSERLDRVPGIKHYTVEVAFGDRPHAIAEDKPNHFKYRTQTEIWHKENMINLALARLPADWQYVAWVDADVEFVDPNWAEETVHLLQHYAFVQLFQTAVDLGPKREAMQVHQGFAYSYVTGQPRNSLGYNYPYPFWHPGFAWAARRDALDNVGGLIETGILGAGDHHMALALIGMGKSSVPGGIHEDYVESVMTWQERAELHIRRNVGYLPGTILHHFHGKKKDRNYKGRWDILIDNKYTPDRDVYKDTQGLWALSPFNIKLRDDIRAYFRARNEDSIDLE